MKESQDSRELKLVLFRVQRQAMTVNARKADE
jgi:hypothetical protein